MKKFDWTKITKGRGDSGKTSTLFGAEVEFHSFVKNLKTYFNANVDAQKVNEISAVLNRLSKYYYLFGRILIHKNLCKHHST